MSEQKEQVRILDKIRQEVKQSFEQRIGSEHDNPAPEKMLYIRYCD